ncbi:hypothetical protein [Moorena sp. SIO3H5]|nr:hypothetical protein [Moorena sp. SIO3H5]
MLPPSHPSASSRGDSDSRLPTPNSLKPPKAKVPQPEATGLDIK